MLDIVTAVGEALDYAHEQGLLHRDVKPANIMLSRSRRRASSEFCWRDFGIARRVDDISGLTATNMTVGTVSYAAPEQLMGDDLDGRADQYALAATAFHLLTGSPPFHALQPDGGHQPAPHSPPPATRRHAARAVRARSGAEQGAVEGPQGPFVTCMDFARALAHRLGVEPDADDERTAASRAGWRCTGHAGGRHEA